MRLALAVLALALAILIPPAPSAAQTSDSLSARRAIELAAEAHGFRFLYRDALLAGLQVPATTSLDELAVFLRSRGITMQIDHGRRVVLLIERRHENSRQPPSIEGRVVDDAAGTPLPHATIHWRRNGSLAGTTTSSNGSFHITLDEPLEITVSYVGYRSQRVRLEPVPGTSRLTVRLREEPVVGREVLVVGSLLQSNLDTTWHYLTRPDLYAPFGEANVIRSLSLLPAAAIAPAGAEGLYLRGSSSDAVHVMLDGITIYNHSHYFGLFDAFNSDALQSIGLYYDVAPARYAAPPGGLLAFETRSGSRTRFASTIGISNTAGRLTLEGPLRHGRTSLLVSGRRSFLEAVDWFGNASLIAYGLDIDRETATLPDGSSDMVDRRTRNVQPDAAFHDLHFRVEDESAGGSTWSASGYIGGNRAAYDAERLLPGAGTDAARWMPVTSDQSWGNLAASLRHSRHISSRSRGDVTIGVSHYVSDFMKDDFTFRRLERPRRVSSFVDFFQQENRLTEWKVDASVSTMRRSNLQLTWGGSLQRFDVSYAEHSAVRPLYELDLGALQIDGFAGGTWHPSDVVELEAGLRAHHFTAGDFQGISPRARALVRISPGIATGATFSRSYQFLHRLALEDVGGPSFWMMSRKGQPPSVGDHVSSGIYLTPARAFALQIEGFHKHTRNVREHEVDVPLWRAPDVYEGSPIITDLTSRSRGIEVMGRLAAGPALLTSAYTLSRTELWSRETPEDRHLAPWDRTHQLTSAVQVDAGRRVRLDITLVAASGAPNELALASDSEPELLSPYVRLDAGLTWRPTSRAEASFSIFNLLDRHNTWYRETVPLVRDRGMPRTIGSATVDVYDLGIRPSFDFKLRL